MFNKWIYNQHLNLLATRGFSLMEKGSYYLKVGEIFSNKTGVIGDILSRMICICTVLLIILWKKKIYKLTSTHNNAILYLKDQFWI